MGIGVDFLEMAEGSFFGASFFRGGGLFFGGGLVIGGAEDFAIAVFEFGVGGDAGVAVEYLNGGAVGDGEVEVGFGELGVDVNIGAFDGGVAGDGLVVVEGVIFGKFC